MLLSLYLCVVKTGAGRPHFLLPNIKLYLDAYHETVWHFDSEERLVNSGHCVTEYNICILESCKSLTVVSRKGFTIAFERTFPFPQLRIINGNLVNGFSQFFSRFRSFEKLKIAPRSYRLVIES